MNLSIAAILGTGESDRCLWRGVKVLTVRQKVAVLERFKQERQVLCCICLPPASYVSATISPPATLE